MYMVASYTNFTDDDQNPSTIRINTERTNDEVEHPEVAEKELSVMEKKQSGERTIPCQNQARNEWIPFFTN